MDVQKLKKRNEKYIRLNLNDYEQGALNAIGEGDRQKLGKYLEYKHVDITKCVNDKGTTFLHYAIMKKDSLGGCYGLGTLELLLMAGADPLATDFDGLTAYDYADIKGFSVSKEILSRWMKKKMNEK